jgi:hypothetical protein
VNTQDRIYLAEVAFGLSVAHPGLRGEPLGGDRRTVLGEGFGQ